MQFLWYDLETFGRDPRRSRIAQFAGIRTDADLHPLEPARMWFCQPGDDLLPSPAACLITGITPQHARAEGLPESEFAALIEEEMSRPDTCVVGYNSFRFDDEFIRNLFYRNFFDPYEREWRNGNSRWDLIDTVRLARALRPQGIQWPQRDDGAPSFKLEHLAAANQLQHEHAHDACSDVEATIALAGLVKQHQPQLFDYALALRDKKKAAAMLDYIHMTPVLHISQRYPAAQGCGALVQPLCPHPSNRNQVIVADLADDPTDLIELPAVDILDRLYTPRADLPEGVQRIGLKQIHLNRAPILVDPAPWPKSDLAIFGIDWERQLEHAQRLREAHGLAEKVRQVFDQPQAVAADLDPELAIYTGFPSPGDKRLLAAVRRLGGKTPSGDQHGFQDPRYEELAFRYRARNYPDDLSQAEHDRWQTCRRMRLAPGSDLSEYDLPTYFAEIETLRAAPAQRPDAQHILDALEDWGRRIERSL